MAKANLPQKNRMIYAMLGLKTGGSRVDAMKTDHLDIRLAGQRDIPALANIYQEAWRGAYRGILPYVELERMVTGRLEPWWQNKITARAVLTLEYDSDVVGYALIGAVRMPRKVHFNEAHQGEICEIYLHPHYQGVGLGRQLFMSCRSVLEQRNLKGLLIWVLRENELARNFYASLGGKLIGSAMQQFGSQNVEKYAYGWPPR